MKTFAQHIDGLMLIDWPTILVIVVLCAAAALVIKEYLAHPPLIIFVYPVLVAFSIVGSYALTQFDLYSPNKFDQWLTYTVLATIGGTVVGMGVVAVVNIIYGVLTAPRRRAVGRR
jgi:hypothetical protein